jgi:hypothetical protein
MQKLLREPVVVSLVTKMLGYLALSHGIKVTYETLFEISILMDLAIAAYVRWQSTPNVKVKDKVTAMLRQSMPPGTIVGLLALCFVGCVPPAPTAAGSLCRARANGKWALTAEAQCPDTDKDSDADWDACPHRQPILDGLAADLKGCPL